MKVELAIARSVLYIREHSRARLPLPYLARQAGMSVSHYCRTFKALIGTSPEHFHREVRVEQAKALLRRKPIEVLRAGKAVGFTHVRTFQRNFKRLTGVPASRYRRDGGD